MAIQRLYAIGWKLTTNPAHGHTWRMERDKRRAVRLAREHRGVVYSMPLSDTRTWDWPTFVASADQTVADYREYAYVLTWIPEGREIARVSARDIRSARRKAPRPYRQYLGEIAADLA